VGISRDAALEIVAVWRAREGLSIGGR